MTLLPDWLAHRANSLPAHPAVELHGRVTSYRALDEQVRALAGALIVHRGVAPGDRVALLAPNSLEFVAAAHAVPRSGAVLVPLNARLSPSELSWQLADCRARLVLCHESVAVAAREAARAAGAEVLVLGTVAAAAAPLRDEHAENEVHSIIYTSGTTGRPKGAMLTFGNFRASAAASALNLGTSPADRWVACMPLFHVGGLSILLRSTIYGTTVLLHESFNEAAVNRALRDEGATLLSVVATMLRRMLDADELPYPPGIRAVLAGGGPVPVDLLERALARGLPVVQTYGLTEAASQVATLAPAEALSHLGSAGKPLSGTSVRIDGPAGAPGEILVAGPTVTPGYFGNPEASEDALRDGWLHTGDIGRLDAEGYLYVLDRRDDLIVTGGENVYPAEVEAVLLAAPGVAQVAVVGVPDEAWGQAVTAVIVPGAGYDEAAVLAAARSQLAGYKLPRRVVLAGSLPTTASGKVQRGAVRAALKLA